MFSSFSFQETKPDETSLIIKDEEITLSESEIVYEVEKPREKESNSTWYMCKFCSYKSSKISYLNLHILNKHPNPKLVSLLHCSDCEFKAKTMAVLNHHMKKHSLKKWLLCDECPYTTSKISTLESHKLNKHGDMGKSGNHLNKHKKTHEIACPDLSTFNVRSEDSLECPFCLFIGRTTQYLKSHIQSVHGTEKILKCDHCPVMAKNETLLVDHIVTIHTCPVSDSSDMTSHYLDVFGSEESVKPIQCAQCPINVGSVELLKKHSLIHGEKVYICSQCSYIARHKKVLTNHMKTTHGQNNSTRKFPCLECGYKTNNIIDLKVHNLMHLRLGKFTCYSCELFFHNDIYLRVHFRICHPQNVVDLSKGDIIKVEDDSTDEEMQDCPQSPLHIKIEEENAVLENVLIQETQNSIQVEEENVNVDPLLIEEFKDDYYILDTPGYQKRFFCKRCSYQSVTIYDMKKHVDYKHAKPEDIVWMNCPLCPYVAKSTHLWSKHLKQRHSDKELEENEDNNIKQLPNADTDDSEFITEELDGRKHFWCMYCSFEAFCDIHIRNHIKLKHRLQCPRCPLKGKTVEHLAKHLNSMHKIDKTFNCDHCSFKSTTETLLVDHIVEQHTDSLDKSASSQILYKLLAKPTNTGVRHRSGIKCLKCSYSTESNKLLQKHMLLHGEKIFSCSKCAYFARQQRILDIHDFDVHCGYKKQLKLSCSQCGYKSQRKTDLRKHEMMYHSKYGNFTCMSCSLIFTSGVYLKVHFRRCHAGLGEDVSR